MYLRNRSHMASVLGHLVVGPLVCHICIVDELDVISLVEVLVRICNRLLTVICKSSSLFVFP